MFIIVGLIGVSVKQMLYESTKRVEVEKRDRRDRRERDMRRGGE
jgi:hypothetical protein